MTAVSPTPHAVRPAGTEIVTLQFMRGVAAMLVVAVHLAERLVKRGTLHAGPDDPIWTLGGLGVTTFFVISGFIMVHTTWDRFGRGGAARQFLLRRLIRIAPLYYLTTAIVIVFQYYTSTYSTNAAYVAPSIVEVVKSFLFIPYVNPIGLMMPVYELGWTLEYEMFFYLLFAGGLLFGRARGIGAVLAALIALVLLGTLMQPVMHDASPLRVLAWFVTRPVILYFASGMVLATILRLHGPFRIALPAGIVMSFAAVALLAAGTTRIVPGFVPATMAVAIAGLVAQQRRDGLFAGVSRVLGDASYSVYLTHSFLLGAIALAAARAPIGSAAAVGLAFVVAATASLLLGWSVWRWVEVPVARRIRRLASLA